MDVLYPFKVLFFSMVYYLATYPDLCITTQIRYVVDMPVAYAETLLHAIHNSLLGRDSFSTVELVGLEIMCLTTSYDPGYYICISVLSWMAWFLPAFLRNFIRYITGIVPPFVVQSALALKRCIIVGMVRDLWKIHYEQYTRHDEFLNPNTIFEKSAVFIFVRFFLSAPPILVCVYWILVIAFEYAFAFQENERFKKKYEDLLLFPVMTLIFVGIANWTDGSHLLSLVYIFISYMLYFYWLLSRYLFVTEDN